MEKEKKSEQVLTGKSSKIIPLGMEHLSVEAETGFLVPREDPASIKKDISTLNLKSLDNVVRDIKLKSASENLYTSDILVKGEEFTATSMAEGIKLCYDKATAWMVGFERRSKSWRRTIFKLNIIDKNTLFLYVSYISLARYGKTASLEVLCNIVSDGGNSNDIESNSILEK